MSLHLVITFLIYLSPYQSKPNFLIFVIIIYFTNLMFHTYHELNYYLVLDMLYKVFVFCIKVDINEKTIN